MTFNWFDCQTLSLKSVKWLIDSPGRFLINLLINYLQASSSRCLVLRGEREKKKIYQSIFTSILMAVKLNQQTSSSWSDGGVDKKQLCIVQINYKSFSHHGLAAHNSLAVGQRIHLAVAAQWLADRGTTNNSFNKLCNWMILIYFILGAIYDFPTVQRFHKFLYRSYLAFLSLCFPLFYASLLICE